MFPWLPSLQGNRCLEIGKIRTSPLLECSLEQESNCWQKNIVGFASQVLQDLKSGSSQAFQMTCGVEKYRQMNDECFLFLLLQGESNLMEHSMVMHLLQSSGRNFKCGRESSKLSFGIYKKVSPKIALVHIVIIITNLSAIFNDRVISVIQNILWRTRSAS